MQTQVWSVFLCGVTGTLTEVMNDLSTHQRTTSSLNRLFANMIQVVEVTPFLGTTNTKKNKKYTYSLEIDASTLNVNDYSQSCWLFEWEEVSGWRCCWGSARNNVFYFLRGPSRVGVRVFSSVSHDVVSVHFTLWSSLHAAFVAPRSLLLKSGRGKTSAINKALFFPTVYNPHFRYLSLCGSCLWIRILLDKSKTTEQGTI